MTEIFQLTSVKFIKFVNIFMRTSFYCERVFYYGINYSIKEQVTITGTYIGLYLVFDNKITFPYKNLLNIWVTFMHTAWTAIRIRIASIQCLIWLRPLFGDWNWSPQTISRIQSRDIIGAATHAGRRTVEITSIGNSFVRLHFFIK